MIALPLVRRAVRNGFPRDEALPRRQRDEVPAFLVVLAVVGVLATAPFTTWRVVEDIAYTSGLSRAEAEGAGASYNSVDPLVFEKLRRSVPAADTYYIEAAAGIQPPARDAFLEWSATVLLPRLPVTDPERADWIVAWGVHPSAVDVDVAEVRILHPPYASFPATYLARVAS